MLFIQSLNLTALMQYWFRRPPRCFLLRWNNNLWITKMLTSINKLLVWIWVFIGSIPCLFIKAHRDTRIICNAIFYYLFMKKWRRIGTHFVSFEVQESISTHLPLGYSYNISERAENYVLYENYNTTYLNKTCLFLNYIYKSSN